eukprot:GDKJ01011415.1.p1 GENE.GDKJ01011415.1~~GDKJ01011415.1.p1  ORF type:complete len:571 (-),score=129.12 GDKJ01011415.1:130-1842(-)
MQIVDLDLSRYENVSEEDFSPELALWKNCTETWSREYDIKAFFDLSDCFNSILWKKNSRSLISNGVFDEIDEITDIFSDEIDEMKIDDLFVIKQYVEAFFKNSDRFFRALASMEFATFFQSSIYKNILHKFFSVLKGVANQPEITRKIFFETVINFIPESTREKIMQTAIRSVEVTLEIREMIGRVQMIIGFLRSAPEIIEDCIETARDVINDFMLDISSTLKSTSNFDCALTTSSDELKKKIDDTERWLSKKNLKKQSIIFFEKFMEHFKKNLFEKKLELDESLFLTYSFSFDASEVEKKIQSSSLFQLIQTRGFKGYQAIGSNVKAYIKQLQRKTEKARSIIGKIESTAEFIQKKNQVDEQKAKEELNTQRRRLMNAASTTLSENLTIARKSIKNDSFVLDSTSLSDLITDSQQLTYITNSFSMNIFDESYPVIYDKNEQLAQGFSSSSGGPWLEFSVLMLSGALFLAFSILISWGVVSLWRRMKVGGRLIDIEEEEEVKDGIENLTDSSDSDVEDDSEEEEQKEQAKKKRRKSVTVKKKGKRRVTALQELKRNFPQIDQASENDDHI